MARTPLSHTADTGVEGSAPTLAGLIAELALGMFELMADIEPCPEGVEVTTRVTATNDEDLVVDSLSELLYMSETGDLVFCSIEVEPAGEGSVDIRATGVPVRDVELTGPPTKAVTYHQLLVTELEDGWYGRVYFDV